MSLASAGEEAVRNTGGPPRSASPSPATLELRVPDLVKLVFQWEQPAVLLDPAGRIASWSRNAARLYGRSRAEGVEVPWPEIVGEVAALAEPPWAGSLRNHFFCTNHEIDSRGLVRMRVSRTDLPVSGGGEGYRLYLITELTEPETLRSRLERRVAELSIIREIAEVLQSAMDLSDILHIILVGATAGQGLSFNRAFLLLADGENNELRGRAAVGPSSPEDASRIWPELSSSGTTLKDLLRSLGPLIRESDRRVNDIAGNLHADLDDADHFLIRAFRSTSTVRVRDGREVASEREVDPALLESLAVRSFVAVPLVDEDRHVGLLLADNAITDKTVEERDVEILELLGMQAAIAIHRSSLTQELQSQAEALEKAYREMRESQRRLLQAERLSTLGQMSASLAHEIRNPLVAMGGFARLLLEGRTEDDRDREPLEIIADEVRRLEGIVGRVLEFSSGDRQRMQWADMSAIAGEAFNLLQWELDKAGIVGLLEADPGAGHVRGDRDRLLQALINLMQNSMHAMPDGGTLSIRIRNGEGWVELDIEDSGTGIQEEVRSGLFEPFTTTRPGGTGLGLPIVSQIIADHGGQISIKSREEQGTTVRLRIPAWQEKEEDDDA
jgi:signal transduction histidine kinase